MSMTMARDNERTDAGPPGGRWPGPSARAGWVMFDWACQPFFTLVTTFIFAPFFAAAVASSPVRGQELWGYATGFAGLVIALCSPALGSIADASGPRKPWIAAFGGLLVLGCGMMWWAVPGAPAAVAIALAGFVIATVGAEFASVFNNAMMPSLAPASRLGRLSGLGWAMGYLGGLVSLALTLVFLAAPPETGRTIAGLVPAFGLDPATHEGDRIAGPFAALWFAVFVLPLFLLTPDMPSSGRSLAQAAREGTGNLARTVRGLSGQRDLFRFLLANMIYADGLVALFAFGGIYAAGTFGWRTTEIGIFGILLTITGTIGALAGGRLDDLFGPRAVVSGSLVLLIVAVLGILGTTRDAVLFIVQVAPAVPGDGLFASTSERAYLALGLLIGVVAGPLQAASRTLLVRLAPPRDIGQCFGLFALSGKVTSFLGPTLVAVLTGITGSQRAGVAVLLAFFVTGLVLIRSLSAGSGGAR